MEEQNEKPDKAGWYWYLSPGDDEPMPERVYIDPEQKELCINVLGYSLRVRDEATGEWLGYIPMPEFQKEDS